MKISVLQQISSKAQHIGADEFTFSVYPASTPIYMELVKNGAVGRSYGSRNDREDSILRTVLRRRRYTGKQCILYPSLNQKLPEP